MPVGFPPGKPFQPAPKARTIVVPGRTTTQRQKSAVDERRLHLELGKLVRRWAWLHEQLAGTFQLASGAEKSVAEAIWHSSKSDAAQRDMLTAALKASIEELKKLPADAHNKFQQDVFAEYVWISDQIGKHSHTRNDLIHSPILLYFSSDDGQFEAVVTNVYSNPRAKKMAGRELFQLARWLFSFCDDIGRHLAAVDSARVSAERFLLDQNSSCSRPPPLGAG